MANIRAFGFVGKLAKLGAPQFRGCNRSYSINNVTIIGGGLMGSGIAQVAAQTGHQVTLVDVSDKVLENSMAIIRKSIARVAKKQFAAKPEDGQRYIDDALGRLKLSTSPEEGVKQADIVVEAIIEDVDAKHKLFKAIDAVAPRSTIFASNTSSLSIAEIAVCTNRLDRFGGLHFFNPVPVMKLLEVIKTAETSEETYQTMMEFGKRLGKQTVTCKDTLGFIVNKLLIQYMGEANRMLERGDATFQDIDTAMKLGAGYPMGPFELQDYTGLDLGKAIADGRRKKFPNDPAYAPNSVIDKRVAEGKFGVKSGEGFYKYPKK